MFWNKRQGTTNRVTPTISVVLTHEVISGNQRYLICDINESRAPIIRFLGSQLPQNSSWVSSADIIMRHVSDSEYRYGVTYTPAGSLVDIHYTLNQSAPDTTYSIIALNPVKSAYYHWVGVSADAIARTQKHAPSSIIDTGLTGIARVCGLHNSPFVYCSIDRYSSTLAYIQNNIVYDHQVVPVGVASMTRLIADVLSCPSDMARSVLLNYGVLSTHYDERLRKRIIAAVTPLLNSIQDFLVTLRGCPYHPAVVPVQPETWVLGGVGAEIPGLEQLIDQSLGLACHDQLSPEFKSLILGIPEGPNRKVLPRYYTLLGLLANQMGHLSK